MSHLRNGLREKVWLLMSQSPVRLLLLMCEWLHPAYDLSFVGTNYLFSAMVFETLGAINTEGEELLQMLFRFASKRLGREFTSYCGRAWARISCNLQRSVSQAILTRIDGCEFSES